MQKEPYLARIGDSKDTITLSSRPSRAFKQFAKLKKAHGTVSLIPPRKVRDQVAAQHALKGKEPRRERSTK